MTKVKEKPYSDLLLFFDFETDQSTGEHLVNFAVCQYMSGRELVFSGYDACEQFCKFLVSPIHKHYTAIAHNMKSFDGQFILKWMLDQGLQPAVIPNGSKLMSIEIQCLDLRIIDSFNFLPMGLSKMPSTFGLTELKKGYFPHLFNTPDNQTYIGTLPSKVYYCPDSMQTAERVKFNAWYEERQKYTFDFQKEMLEYCR